MLFNAGLAGPTAGHGSVTSESLFVMQRAVVQVHVHHHGVSRKRDNRIRIAARTTPCWQTACLSCRICHTAPVLRVVEGVFDDVAVWAAAEPSGLAGRAAHSMGDPGRCGGQRPGSGPSRRFKEGALGPLHIMRTKVWAWSRTGL